MGFFFTILKLFFCRVKTHTCIYISSIYVYVYIYCIYITDMSYNSQKIKKTIRISLQQVEKFIISLIDYTRWIFNQISVFRENMTISVNQTAKMDFTQWYYTWFLDSSSKTIITDIWYLHILVAVTTQLARNVSGNVIATPIPTPNVRNL